MGFDRIADATDKQLAIAQKWANENAKSYRKKVNQAVDAGQRTVKASGKTDMMSVAEATSRAMQYEAFSKAIAKEVFRENSLVRMPSIIPTSRKQTI